MKRSLSPRKKEVQRAAARKADAHCPLTKEEKLAITKLKRLAEKWPDSIWLASMAGYLYVMHNGPDGKPVYHHRTGGLDQRLVVCKIEGIQNDGGDW